MFCCFPSRDDSRISDTTCVFCNITENVGTRVTDDLAAFKDRSPSANVHLLVIPKQHVRTVKSLDGNDAVLLSKMIEMGRTLLKEQGYDPDNKDNIRLGFHVPPFNSVNHLHMHVIGLPFKNKLRSFKYRIGYPWYADAHHVLNRLENGLSPV